MLFRSQPGRGIAAPAYPRRRGRAADRLGRVHAQSRVHAVDSPGGTTAAALAVLMANEGMPDLLKRAVAAAAKRSRELSS